MTARERAEKLLAEASSLAANGTKSTTEAARSTAQTMALIAIGEMLLSIEMKLVDIATNIDLVREP